LHRSRTPPEAEPSWSPPELSPERSFLCKLLTQRIAKGEVLTQVALIFVSAGDGLAWEDYEEAWGLLDVAGQDVNDGDDAHKALETYATRGPAEAAPGQASPSHSPSATDFST